MKARLLGFIAARAAFRWVTAGTFAAIAFLAASPPPTAMAQAAADRPLTLEERMARAVPAWTALAEKGDAQAEAELARAYFLGVGVAKDRAKAESWAREASEQGNALGQAICGNLLLQSGDTAGALRTLRLAADQNEPLAEVALGGIYATGTGVPRDLAEAEAWWRKADALGATKAQIGLGRLRENRQAFSEAFGWYLKAARAGDDEGQFLAARGYYLGEGVAKDQVEAVKWLGLSAGQGNLDAQYFLADSYLQGIGTAKDLRQAAHWMEIAAERGSADAAFELGGMFATGTGEPADPVHDYVWLRRADKLGSALAASRLLTIAARMSPPELALAQKRADDWRPNPEFGRRS